MAKVNKDQDTPVVVPIPATAEQAEQAIQGAVAVGAAGADVAEAPVSKDSLPTPPAATKTATDAATSDADAAMPGKSDGQDVKPAVRVLRVVSKREGFRRAGIRFGVEPVILLLADLTAEQLDLIIFDPMLEAVPVVAE